MKLITSEGCGTQTYTVFVIASAWKKTWLPNDVYIPWVQKLLYVNIQAIKENIFEHFPSTRCHASTGHNLPEIRIEFP